MNDHRPLFETMLAWGGAPMAIATVIATWGSAPRPRGSHMLVHIDGRFEGSVSGGCVEGDVLESAAAVIATGIPRRMRYGVAQGDAWEFGLPCGGDIEILVQPVSAGHFPPALATEILAGMAAGDPVVVATDVHTGQSSLLPEAAARAASLFCNHYAPAHRLLIVGAVQIAQSLTRYAATLGIEAIVIDPRSRFLTPERFPGVILDDRWPDTAIEARAPDSSTAVVTLSHDIKIDDPALIAALSAPTAYIAALGSSRSHRARCLRLIDSGFGPAEIDRIEGPAGLAIGAVNPAEIALSIAAGMVRAFRMSSTSSHDCGVAADDASVAGRALELTTVAR